MTIWKQCNGEQQIKPIHAEPWRVVESQSILTARDLVDSNEEFEILEEMIETSKPKAEALNTHYLIFTPFRYPPLKHGSRFGRTFEKSLWYGSLQVETALAEVAYYRLLFLKHSHANLGSINLSLTSFQSCLKTSKGIDLTVNPFDSFENKISSKSNYSHSQQLGTDMRNAEIEAFIFKSARALQLGKNIAAFTPAVFHKKKNQYVFNTQNWQCSINKKSVLFINQNLEKVSFTSNHFSNDGQFDHHPEFVA